MEAAEHARIWREMFTEMNARRCDASSHESENQFRRMEIFCRLAAEKYEEIAHAPPAPLTAEEE